MLETELDVGQGFTASEGIAETPLVEGTKTTDLERNHSAVVSFFVL